MPPSSSRSKTSPEPTALPGGSPAISVDVEEWYHNCWVPEYNDPSLRRLPLETELPELLPRLAAELEACGARATFFVLGEVAPSIARELRELRSRGHEIACHSLRHLRANDLAPARFFAEIRAAKALLEDLVGAEVRGFRAPEWSLRSPANPRLRLVAEAGFAYDSSLVRALGAGSPANPVGPVRFVWPDGLEIVEVPPLTWAGQARLPAGGWCGRAASPRWILAAARAALREGRMPLLVVHPWELTDRPCPGLLTGLARFLHEAGRRGFAEKFRVLAAALPWGTIERGVRAALAADRRGTATESGLRDRAVEIGSRAAVS